jgi:hypothetical protein
MKSKSSRKIRYAVVGLRTIQAIYESAHTAKPVHLPPFSKRTRPTPRQEIGRPAHGRPKTVKVKSASGEAA